MKRPVIVWVDDPDVTHLAKIRGGPDGKAACILTQEDYVPIPPDDQLTHDIRRLARLADANARAMDHANDRHGADALRGSVKRLRGSFHLDEAES